MLWGNGLEADSSGWIRTSNPPVNRRKTPVLPPVAAPCADAPDRELDRINTGPIDDPTDASDGLPNPPLGVSKVQEKGKVRGSCPRPFSYRQDPPHSSFSKRRKLIPLATFPLSQ